MADRTTEDVLLTIRSSATTLLTELEGLMSTTAAFYDQIKNVIISDREDLGEWTRTLENLKKQYGYGEYATNVNSIVYRTDLIRDLWSMVENNGDENILLVKRDLTSMKNEMVDTKQELETYRDNADERLNSGSSSSDNDSGEDDSGGEDDSE